MESMEVTPPQGNLLTTSPKEDLGRFTLTMLRPTSLERRTTRQLGRRVYSPMVTDSTAVSVKAVVLLAGEDGLVVLVSVPLVLMLRLVLPVFLESEIRAVEKKSGMNRLSGLIPFGQISQTLWTTTLTRNTSTKSDDRPCPLATSTGWEPTIKTQVMEAAVIWIAVIEVREAVLKGTPFTIIGVTKKIPSAWYTKAVTTGRAVPVEQVSRV